METFHKQSLGFPHMQHLHQDPSLYWVEPQLECYQMQPAGVVIHRESYSSYVTSGAYKLRRFTVPINTACDQYCSIANQLYRLERALIDTGEATPPKKQSETYTSRVGSYWARLVSIFNIKFIIIFITSLSIISFKILYSRVSEALDFYRFYSTKHGIRS